LWITAANTGEINLLVFFLKFSRAAAQRCEEVRQKFAFEISSHPPKYLVAVDEAVVNVLTTYG